MRIYLISSFLASLAGVLYVFRSGVGNFTTMSASYELFAIAAVVIGGASLFGGKGGIGGTTIGVPDPADAGERTDDHGDSRLLPLHSHRA